MDAIQGAVRPEITQDLKQDFTQEQTYQRKKAHTDKKPKMGITEENKKLTQQDQKFFS